MSPHSHQPRNKPLVFAHRGANREAFENTRGAFDKALGYAIDGIETDVQLSRDEIAVLWHDRFLNKIGLGDKHIDDFDYRQLTALIHPQSDNEGLMTLQDFLATYRTRCRLLLEVKNRDWEAVSRHQLKIRQTLDLAGQNPEHSIMVSSFNLASLEYAHQYRPEFPLIYNFEDDQTIADARTILSTHAFLSGLCVPIQNLDCEMVELLRGQGKCVAVYTCNSEAEITQALQLDVDILISDLPQQALALRDR
jgi:glycerophosphoryl diester phosphodiesterase